ncbi:hypothetical protein FRC12_013685 [Ceratobasidium sp. 428]|nr:hypothetical protein FRC12_013685 [Ceratobasidium sp. 428]
MQSTVVFANDFSPKDFVGQYYGYNEDVYDMLSDESDHDYRKAVFAVMDLMSTDSLAILGEGRQTSPPILHLSTSLDVGAREFGETEITYMNGTMQWFETLTGPASTYRDSLYNSAAAVTHAIRLDLRNAEPNVFMNRSAINDTFISVSPPSNFNPTTWARNLRSFYYGTPLPPYQTWAQMLRAGLPHNVTLGDLTDLPGDSQLVTSYLCPSYHLKPLSSLLASIFIGTATMFMSVWATWVAISSFVAKKASSPCAECVFGSGEDKPCVKHPSMGNSRAPASMGYDFNEQDVEKNKYVAAHILQSTQFVD